MTPYELVKDTIEYYKTHPRAINDDGQCEYKNCQGNMCAVGRWMNWEKIKSNGIREGYINGLGSIEGYDNEGVNIITDHLVDKVKDLPTEVWIDLQDYHDYTLKCENPVIIENRERRLLEKWKEINTFA